MAQRHRMADGTRGRISAIPAGTGHGGDYRPLCPNAVSTISAIPAGTGYGGDYRPLCPNTVPMISRPLKASALYTKVSAILRFVPAETPLPRCSLDTDQVSASRAVHPQWLARPPPHPLRGSPRAPTTHRIGWDWHAAPLLPGRTTPTATPPQEQATGFGHAAPVGTMPHSNTCTVPVLPSTIKGEDLGHLERGTKKTHTRTHSSRLRATSQTVHTTPCRDLGLVPSLP